MQSTPRLRPAPLSSSSLFESRLLSLIMLVAAAGVAATLWVSSTLAMVVALAGVCIVFAQKHYGFYVLAAFALFPFQQAIGGEGAVNLSFTDCFLLVAFTALPHMLLSRGRCVVGPAGFCLLLFLSLSIVSSALYWDGLNTAVSLARMWVATLLPVLLFANGDSRPAFPRRCFHLFLAGINALSVFSVLAFAQGGVNASMYTLGINKNALGPTFGCGIVIALVYLLTEQASGRYRLWLLLTVAGASVGSLLSLSRGGWVATAAALALLLLMLRQIKAFIISVVVLVPLLFIVWRMLPEKATTYATDISTNAHTAQTRFDSINQVLNAYEDSPLIGVGVGLRKRIEPHNVLVLTLGEEGILGECCFIAMFIGGFSTFVVAWKRAGGDTESLQIVMIGACLLLLSLAAGMLDVYWRRGVGFLGWASVGMAVNIIEQARRGRRPSIGFRVADPFSDRVADRVSLSDTAQSGTATP